MNKLLFAPLTAALFAAVPLHAQKGEDMVEIRGDKPVALRSDRAYLLFRTNMGGVSPVFLRVPTDSEMARYEAAKQEAFRKAEPGLIRARDELLARRAQAGRTGPRSDKPVPPIPSLENFNFVYEDIKNAQTVNIGRALEKSGDRRTLLVETMPGNYVIYGLGFGEIFQTCLCLGTVSFPAAAGTITDMGTVLIGPAAEKSDVPELAGETGFGPSMNGHLVTWAAAIRPASPSTPIPTLLAGKPVVPAAYRATGKFVAGFSFAVNRLAPLPGVLGYDRGNVLDLVSNKVAENQY